MAAKATISACQERSPAPFVALGASAAERARKSFSIGILECCDGSALNQENAVAAVVRPRDRHPALLLHLWKGERNPTQLFCATSGAGEPRSIRAGTMC